MLAKGNTVINDTRDNGKYDKTLEEYYEWVDEYVTEQYALEFNLK